MTTGADWFAGSESGGFKNIATCRNCSLQNAGPDMVVIPRRIFFAQCGINAAVVTSDHKMPELGRVSRNCLECAAIFRHLPLTVRLGLGTIQER
jgi:hypothetical protein